MMSGNRTNEVVDIINHFFVEQNIMHELLVASDRFVYRCGFTSHSSRYSNLGFELVVDESAMQSYVFLPTQFTINEDVVAKYISRINPEFKLGRFQFNCRNGHIAFHFGQRIDVVVKGMSRQILMDQIYYPLTIMDRFADGFFDLAQGTISLEEAANKYLSANHASDDKNAN